MDGAAGLKNRLWNLLHPVHPDCRMNYCPHGNCRWSFILSSASDCNLSVSLSLSHTHTHAHIDPSSHTSTYSKCGDMRYAVIFPLDKHDSLTLSLSLSVSPVCHWDEALYSLELGSAVRGTCRCYTSSCGEKFVNVAVSLAATCHFHGQSITDAMLSQIITHTSN